MNRTTMIVPFSFEPRTATPQEIAERNRALKLSGTREFLTDVEAACQMAGDAKSGVSDRLYSWSCHPDERVALSLICNRDLVRQPGKGHADDLQSVQEISRILPVHAVQSARRRALAWTAVLDALSNTGIESLAAPGRRFLEQDRAENGPLVTWLSQASEADLLAIVEKGSADFRQAVYAGMRCFTDVLRERAEADETTGLHGLASNPHLPVGWAQEIAERAVDYLDPATNNYSHWQSHGRTRKYAGVSRESAGKALSLLARAGHSIPDVQVERLRVLAEPQDREGKWGVPPHRSISFQALLSIPGALDAEGIRDILARDVWRADELPWDQLLDSPQMPADLWPVLLSWNPNKTDDMLRKMERRINEGPLTPGLADVIRGDSRSFAPYRIGEGEDAFRSSWRVLAQRNMERALEVLQTSSPERIATLRRVDWAFLLDVTRDLQVRRANTAPGHITTAEQVDLAGRLLMAIPEAASDPEVRLALRGSYDAEIIRKMLRAGRADEVRPLLRHLTEVDRFSAAALLREEGAAAWLGFVDTTDLVPLLSSSNGEVRQTAISVMGQVATQRAEGVKDWATLQNELTNSESGQRAEAWAQAVERFPRELMGVLQGPDGETLLSAADPSHLRKLREHPDRLVRADARYALPSGGTSAPVQDDERTVQQGGGVQLSFL